MAVNRSFAKNYDMGGGELFIRFTGEDNFRYFGATNAVKLNFKIDKLEHKNSESETVVTDLEVVKEVSAEVSFTTEDLNKDVLALAFGGDVVETTQSSGSATVSFTAVGGGSVYELGKIKVSNVAVTYTDDDGDTAQAILDVDYSLNEEFGTIEIAKGGAIDGKDITVSFDYAATTKVEFTSLNNVSREVALRFVGRNQVGHSKQTTIHRVILTLNGDYNLKSSDNINSLSFNGKVLKDTTKPEGRQFVETVMVGA